MEKRPGAYILLTQEISGSGIKARPYFLTDATVNIDPSAEDLAETLGAEAQIVQVPFGGEEVSKAGLNGLPLVMSRHGNAMSRAGSQTSTRK